MSKRRPDNLLLRDMISLVEFADIRIAKGSMFPAMGEWTSRARYRSIPVKFFA
jgi:hypothetical protein